MPTRVRSLAIESIADRLALADFEERHLFPPTELYGEGWMLRLVLDSAFRASAKLPFPILNGARVIFSCDAWCGVSRGLACPDPSSD